MTLTQHERARLAGLWRELARRARIFVADPGAQHPEFRKLAAEAPAWASPLDTMPDAFMLFGFARLAAGLAKAPLLGIPPRGRAVAHVAEVVADLLGEEPEDDADAVNAWWKDH